MTNINNYRIAICLAGIFTWASSCSAGTFDSYMSYFYNTNPSIMASEKELDAQNESYVQSREAFGPQASLNFEEDYQKAKVNQANIFGEASIQNLFGRTSTSSLSITQHIFSDGRLTSQMNEAEANVMSAREASRLAVSQAFSDAIAAYIDVVRDEAVLAATKGAQALLENDLSEMEEKFKAGAATIADRALVIARLAAARTQVAAEEGELQQSRAAFLAIIGQEPEGLTAPPSLPALPRSREDAVEAAIADNPSLREAIFDETSARTRVALAKSAFGPDVSLQLTAQSVPLYQYVTGMQDRNLTAGIVVQMPVFRSGILVSKLRQAEAQDRSERLKVEVARRSATRAAEQYFAQYRTSLKQLAFLTEQVRADRVAYESFVQQFRSGLISTIDLLNSEQELNNAQVSLENERHDEVMAEVNLLAVSGRLEADVLIPSVKPRNPEVVFRKLHVISAVLPTTILARKIDHLVPISDIAPPQVFRMPLETQITTGATTSTLDDMNPTRLDMSDQGKEGGH